MKNCLLSVTVLMISFVGSCQHSDRTSQLQSTTETIIRIDNLNSTRFMGYQDNAPVFMRTNNIFQNDYSFFVFNEETESLHKFTEQFNPPFPESNWETGFLNPRSYQDKLWLYTVGYSNDDYSIYYQTLWTQVSGKNMVLDTISNADKKVKSFISPDGTLIINTLNTLSDYFHGSQDNRFISYHIEDLKQGRASRREIRCTYCSDPLLAENKTFFSKSNQRDDFDNGFHWTDLYVAEAEDLSDSVKIASFTTPVAVTPDGKYVLAKRIRDLQNSPMAIVDVVNKRYQLLLGRDYTNAQAFYSFSKKKFAFLFGGNVVYVDFPESYPFNALKARQDSLPNWSNRDFYRQFDHKKFD